MKLYISDTNSYIETDSFVESVIFSKDNLPVGWLLCIKGILKNIDSIDIHNINLYNKLTLNDKDYTYNTINKFLIFNNNDNVFVDIELKKETL